MADLLDTAGKVAGMTGIRSAIGNIILFGTGNQIIDGVSVSSTDFDISSSTGTLSNNTAIDFTISSGDVGLTADYVQLLDNTVDQNTLLRIDLDDEILLTTAGTATLAIGDLTAVL